MPVVRALTDKARVALSFDAIGFILGLGYVSGTSQFPDSLR